jgi:nucleoside-diphosphate-sugar epimerase
MLILVTGSEGLIGRHLCPLLQREGHEVIRFDKRLSPDDDVGYPLQGDDRFNGIDGIVHLAALARIIWCEEDPLECASTNVGGVLNALDLAFATKAWMLFSSSREVYGETPAADLPVKEDRLVTPINVYACSKVVGERAVISARKLGIKTGVLRFSNVYGDVHDHDVRVIPAFSKTAAFGGSITVNGSHKVFDLTHVSDVIRGVLTAINMLAAGDQFPTTHLVSGKGTSLGTLAELAMSQAHKLGRNLEVRQGVVTPLEVASFVGDPTRAEQVLGWKASVPVSEGFERLVDDFYAANTAAAVAALTAAIHPPGPG